MREISFFIFVSLIAVIFPSHVFGGENHQMDKIKARLHNSNDVIVWSKENLHYQNDDPWDKAPSLDSIIANGYGDCKMLAGVVAELLRHVGVENRIVTIKRKDIYHMFNVFTETPFEYKVIDNARLVPDSFNSFAAILNYYGVSAYEAKHRTYNDFKQWFNEKNSQRGHNQK